MSKALQIAIEKASALPESAQERLGLDLIDYIARLDELRAEIDIGIRELDAGEGAELDVEDVIRQARADHGRAT